VRHSRSSGGVYHRALHEHIIASDSSGTQPDHRPAATSKMQSAIPTADCRSRLNTMVSFARAQSESLARASSRTILRLAHRTMVALAFASASTAPVTRPSTTDYHWVQPTAHISIMRYLFGLARKGSCGTARYSLPPTPSRRPSFLRPHAHCDGCATASHMADIHSRDVDKYEQAPNAVEPISVAHSGKTGSAHLSLYTICPQVAGCWI
jgi:hypothetical protein